MSSAVECIRNYSSEYAPYVRRGSERYDQGIVTTFSAHILDIITNLWGREIISIGHVYDEALDSLDAFFKEYSSAGWDGYGAPAISTDTYIEAIKIINQLPSSMITYDIVAEPTGDIGFEWYKSDERIFVISVGGKNRVSYAGLFGLNKMHGTEYFGGTLPSVVLEHLNRLFA